MKNEEEERRRIAVKPKSADQYVGRPSNTVYHCVVSCFQYFQHSVGILVACVTVTYVLGKSPLNCFNMFCVTVIIMIPNL